jgi:hypothetical protein
VAMHEIQVLKAVGGLSVISKTWPTCPQSWTASIRGDNWRKDGPKLRLKK